MAENQGSARVAGEQKAKFRRGKLVQRSGGDCAAQRDALLRRLNETREALDVVEAILEVYPATREGVEETGKNLAAVLVDQGFQTNRLVKGLFHGTAPELSVKEALYEQAC
ncbi:hypothetical protein [Fundidesulfovibrio agrisoli]|uniref:hypothetical protein n=1 Tax=Fundidesulfovibrio agrisoli TaxID=2922717 RepID=UPI001FABD7AE|nr:hypothetical protein [Fundidesulfovibrio agrisoli]